MAIQLKPDYADAHFNLGVAYASQAKFEEAVRSFRQAVKFRPDYAEAWGGLVKVYLAMHEDEKAGEATREMKRIDPAKAEQLVDELSREGPKPVAEATQSATRSAEAPSPVVARPQPAQ